MSENRRAESLERTLYLIEKDYQTRISPHQKALNDLKQEYERALSHAQKAFEENERHFQEQLSKTKRPTSRKRKPSKKITKNSAENNAVASRTTAGNPRRKSKG